MTKGIEDMLNLPSMDDIIKTKEPVIEQEIEQNDDYDLPATYDVDDMSAAIEAAEQKMNMLKGDGHSEAMDTIHEDTLKHARDLMDLGFNVDQRSAATIFEKANMLYKTALDAKHSKRDMQLRAMKLALDQKKLELEEQRLKFEMGDRSNEVVTEATVLLDRNDFVRKFREQMKDADAQDSAAEEPAEQTEEDQG